MQTQPMTKQNSPTTPRARRTLATAVLLFAAASGGVSFALRAQQTTRVAYELTKPAPALDGRPARLEQAARSTCNECHASIVEEWAVSTHAQAWVNDLYQEDLEGRKKADACHGCHIPAPLHALPDLSHKPEPRPADAGDAWHFGVSCESCHTAADGALLGPTGAATDAHATRKHESFVGAGSNALCASCHKTTVGPVIGIAKDFLASEAAAGGASCVECHLAVLREVDDGAGGKRAVRSHELQSARDPSFLSQSFEFEVLREGELVRLRIGNRAGHRVPGLVGRALEFRARLLDAAGKERASARIEFDSSAYLPMGESVELEVGRGGARLELEGWRHDPRLEKPARFLERQFELGSNAGAR